MEEITTSTPLADIVEAVPGSRRTLEGLGLDYCCGGRRSLASACDDLGLVGADVLEQVRRSEPEPAAAWTGMGPDALVDHIEAVHHAYLHAELEADTHLHVHKENNLLFPAVVALERRLTTAPA
jgi:regulator of cell morphogenesis and NO signaling